MSRTSTEASGARSHHRHRRWAVGGLTALAAAGVVMTSGCSAAGTATGASPAAAAPTAHGKRDHRGIAGQISAMNGSIWTVTTARGVAYTVNLTPTTAFGSKAAPETQSQFTTGERIRVLGQPSDKTVTATRVVAAPARGTTQTSPGGSAVPAPATGSSTTPG